MFNNFVSKDETIKLLKLEDYYVKDKQIVSKFLSLAKNGEFIIRDPSSGSHQFTLLIKSPTKIWRIQVFVVGNKITNKKDSKNLFTSFEEFTIQYEISRLVPVKPVNDGQSFEQTKEKWQEKIILKLSEQPEKYWKNLNNSLDFDVNNSKILKKTLTDKNRENAKITLEEIMKESYFVHNGWPGKFIDKWDYMGSKAEEIFDKQFNKIKKKYETEPHSFFVTLSNNRHKDPYLIELHIDENIINIHIGDFYIQRAFECVYDGLDGKYFNPEFYSFEELLKFTFNNSLKPYTGKENWQRNSVDRYINSVTSQIGSNRITKIKDDMNNNKETIFGITFTNIEDNSSSTCFKKYFEENNYNYNLFNIDDPILKGKIELNFSNCFLILTGHCSSTSEYLFSDTNERYHWNRIYSKLKHLFNDSIPGKILFYNCYSAEKLCPLVLKTMEKKEEESFSKTEIICTKEPVNRCIGYKGDFKKFIYNNEKIYKFQFISKDKNFEFIIPLWMLFEGIFLRNSPIHQVSGGGFDKSKIRQAAYDSMYGKLSYY